MMRISTDGIQKLQAYEGLSLKPYRDAGGLWTIGYGHLIKQGEKDLMRTITEREAHEIFVNDLVPFVERISRYVKVPLTQKQFDALVIWDFNTGRAHNSELIGLINAKASPQTIFDWWVSHYITAQGKYTPGLVVRRRNEANMFTSIPGSSQAGSGSVALVLIGLALTAFFFSKRKRKSF